MDDLSSRLRALPTKKSGTRAKYPPLVSADGILADEHLERRQRVLTQVSPSQIDLWDKCARKWWHGYIRGIKQEQSNAQAAGTDIDDNYAQPYLLERPAPDIPGKWQKLLDALKPHLPAPGTAIVQAEISFRAYDGGPFVVNYPDWLTLIDPVTVGNGDLKTTSKKQYVKTRAQLEDNTQLISYARGLFDLVKPEYVEPHHVTAIRDERNPKVFRTPSVTESPIRWDRAAVEQRWAPRERIVREMMAAARSCASADELPPNTEECGEWGGCAYRSECGLLTPVKSLFRKTTTPPIEDQNRTTTMTTTNPLLEKLRARGASPAAPAPVAPAAPAPASYIRAPAPAAPASAAAQEPLKQELDALVSRIASAEEKPKSPMTLQDDSQPVPPDAPSRTSSPGEIEAVDAVVKEKAKKKKAKDPADMTEEELEEHLAKKRAEKAAQKAAEEQAAKKKAEDAALEVERQKLRDAGRPSLQKQQEAAQAALDQHSAKAAMDAASAALKQELDANIPGRAERKRPAIAPTLYLDCAPSKGSHVAKVVELETWLAPIEELAAAAYVDDKGRQGVADWRMIAYSADGVLATAIRGCLDTCPEVLVIDDSTTRAARVALEVLVPHAAQIVRGRR